jgi:muconolactone D-isomerase
VVAAHADELRSPMTDPIAAGAQEFLVRISVQVDPAAMSPDRFADLLQDERARGAELVRAGAIKHIWRLPGTSDNAGIWTAPNATVLHDLISSLPLFRWMTVAVTPLATHPLEPVLQEVRR